MLNYYYGADAYGAREAVNALAAEHKAVIRWLDKEDFQIQPLSAWLDRGGGLFGRELLVVRDPSVFPKVIQENIIQTLSRLGRDPANRRGQPLVLWDRADPDKRSALFRALKPYAKEFSLLDRQALVQWTLVEAKKRSGDIAPQAAQMLIDRVGNDRFRIASELEKLLILHAMVTPEVIAEHVPAAILEAEIFALIDAIAAGRSQHAIRMIEAALQAQASEFYILSMVAYQFRVLYMIKSGLAHKLNPYVVQKNTSVAERFSAHELLHALTKVMATDFAIKQGKIDARTGLAMLVIGLVQHASTRQKITP